MRASTTTNLVDAVAALDWARAADVAGGGRWGHRLSYSDRLRGRPTGHGDRKEGEGEDEVESGEGTGEHCGYRVCCW